MSDTRLAVYGTLAPGKANHHQLGGLAGTWTPGSLRGRLGRATWGEHTGLPGLILDDAAGEIAVQIFTSPDLPAHWARLDVFEGEAFARVVTRVATDQGEVEACVYVLA